MRRGVWGLTTVGNGEVFLTAMARANVALKCGDSMVVSAAFSSSLAIVVGRAASGTGQSSMAVAEMERLVVVDSCDAQCAWPA